jgi:Fe-S cluster assembly scaffold protein SufB
MAATAKVARWLEPERVRSLSASLSDPPRIAKERSIAAERVGELPLEPNPLYRQYGYFNGVDLTGLDPLSTGAPVPAPPIGERTVQVLHDVSGSRFRCSPDLSAGSIRFTPLPELWAGGEESASAFYSPPRDFSDRLSALATAVLNRGYRLELPGSTAGAIRVQDIAVLSRPREALSIRRQVQVPDGGTAIVSEESFSTLDRAPGQRLFASDTEIELGTGAKAVVLTVHALDDEAVSIYFRRGKLGHDARLTWIWSGFGGFRTKVRNLTELVQPGGVAEDLQTFFGDKSQSYDSGIEMRHVATDTHGTSVTRGVFRDEARGMSRGLVRIESEARRTLSYLSEHAMLLSRGARSDTIPILEILCRDVKATHSSSVAPVDPEKVFYLESRGIVRDRAIRMIGEGFLSHVLERSPIAQLRELLYPHLATRWEGKPIPWDPDALPSLPALHLGGPDANADWRFDAKLR